MCFKYLGWVNIALSCLGCPVLISIDFDDFTLPFTLSFCFDWEDISNTRDSVSSAIHTPRISLKILRCASYFQLSSRCLDIPMKHCLSCLIYIVKHERACLTTFPNNSAEYFDELREMFGNVINHCGVFDISICSIWKLEIRRKRRNTPSLNCMLVN